MECGLPHHSQVITLAHGGGGRLTQQLIDQIFKPAFKNIIPQVNGSGLEHFAHDAAQVPLSFSVNPSRMVMSTDSFVISPLEFPGGDIGKLSVMGTCNDLAMSGAKPICLSVSFILEEGLEIKTLERITNSIRDACIEIGVPVICGDTKVVQRGKGDQIFINTTGIGMISEAGTSAGIHPSSICEGDIIIVSGDIGRHGATILCSRPEFGLKSSLRSDCQHLWPLVKKLSDSKVSIHCLRDLTRGGLSTALYELAESSGLTAMIDQKSVPIASQVQSVCDLLGLDPYTVACEGRMVIIVPSNHSALVLSELDSAAIIGRFGHRIGHSRVILNTNLGSQKSLALFSGENLPRIC